MLSQLIDMLCGVASGMQHIVSKSFVHTVNELLLLVSNSLMHIDTRVTSVDRCN